MLSHNASSAGRLAKSLILYRMGLDIFPIDFLSIGLPSEFPVLQLGAVIADNLCLMLRASSGGTLPLLCDPLE